MDGLSDVARNALPWLISVSWQVAVLALAVVLITRALGSRCPPGVHYALWLVVVARLVLPPLPELAIGLTPRAVATTESSPGPTNPPPPAWWGSDYPGTVTPPSKEESDLAVPPPPPEAGTAPPEPKARRDSSPVPLLPPASSPLRDDAPQSPGPAPVGWASWIVGAWIVGALIAAIRLLVREGRFRRRLRHAKAATPRVTNALDSAARSLALRRPVRALVTTDVSTPALWGVHRPTVLLPPDLSRQLDPEELRHVLLHEVAHARRLDVAANWLLLAVRCAHWFNPFAHLAVSRLQTSREAVRDRQVLRCSDAPDPRAYGRTLIRLIETCQSPVAPAASVGAIENAHDMRWRITMISSFSRPRPLGFLIGTVLASVVGGAALIGASQEATLADGRGESSTTSQPQIKVVREAPDPAWKQALRKQLDQTGNFDFDEVEFGDAVKYFRKIGLNIVVGEDAEGEYGGEEINLKAQAMSIGAALHAVCRQVDLGYTLRNGVVYIDSSEAAFDPVRRIYNVKPLFWRNEEGERCGADELQELLRNVAVRRDEFDREGSYMAYWGHLLCIGHSADVHDRLEAFCNRLLNDGKLPNEKRAPWRDALDEQLEKPIDVSFDDLPLDQAIKQLRDAHGLDLVIEIDHIEDGREISLDLKQVPLGRVLAWMGTIGDFRIDPRDGVLSLCEAPRPRLEFYKIGDLVKPRDEDESADERQDQLKDLIRDNVARSSWDEEGVLITFWKDLMIVRQGDRAHAAVARFLDSLRRAN